MTLAALLTLRASISLNGVEREDAGHEIGR